MYWLALTGLIIVFCLSDFDTAVAEPYPEPSELLCGGPAAFRLRWTLDFLCSAMSAIASFILSSTSIILLAIASNPSTSVTLDMSENKTSWCGRLKWTESIGLLVSFIWQLQISDCPPLAVLLQCA